MVFPLSNLPSESAPWARQIQSTVEDLLASTKLDSINTAARNKQYTATVKRLDAAITSLATKVGSVGSINFTGTQTFTPAVASAQAVIARAYTGQTANIQEWQGPTGTVLTAVDANGFFVTPTLTSPTLNTPTLNSMTSGAGIREKMYFSGTGFSGYTFYMTTNGAVQFADGTATANGVLNITSTSGQTLASVMSANTETRITFIVNNGATAYYPTSVTIDGSAPTAIKWQTAAPTAGNINSWDVYNLRIQRTGSGWYVLASQTKYA